jgi:Flp pilus assembly protein TadG
MKRTSDAANSNLGHKPQRPQWLQDDAESGQSAIELAVCLPMLLILVTGLCTYGLAINKYMILTDAVNEGARQLAVSRGQTTDPCASTVSSVTAAAPSLTASNLTFSININGSTYAGTSCSSASTYTGAAGNLQLGVPAGVTVTYPCTLGMFRNSGPSSCTLMATTTELVQ